MIRLLNAGFMRLRKGNILKLLVLYSVGLALFMIYAGCSEMKKYESVIEVEQLMLNYAPMVGIVISIFTSLFLGVEYSDGGIRNKISMGYKRSHIYLSSLILTTLTSWAVYSLFILVIITIGIPLLGRITISTSTLLLLIGCIFILMLSYCSLFTFFAMIISNKTITAIVSIMVAFGLLMTALTCLNVLEAPKSVQTLTMVEGEPQFEEIPNPKYPSEMKRKICQTLLDVTPSGQALQVAGRMTPDLKILPLYSLGVVIVFTATGLFLFKKKELK